MYQIFLNGELLCETGWPPLAQAAWNKAARDRHSAQHGGTAAIIKDGHTLSSVRPRMKQGHPWPDPDVPEVSWHDVVKQFTLLCRDNGIGVREIADRMTERHLPTTRSRIDALRGSTQGKRTEVTPGEMVVMIEAVIDIGVKGD